MDLGAKLTARHRLMIVLYFTHIWSTVQDKLLLNLESAKKYQCDRQDYQHSESERQYHDLVQSKSGLILPRLPVVLRAWHVFSTTVHLANILFSLFLVLNYYKDGRLVKDEHSITCFVPRFAPHEMIKQKDMAWIGGLLSSLHIAWRLLMSRMGRNFRLDMVSFILWDSDIIRLASNWQTATRSIQRWNTLDGVQKVFFYTIQGRFSKARVQINMRPNRTIEAHFKLCKLLSNYFNLALVLLSLIAPTMIFYGTKSIYFRHEIIYEGCKVVYFDTTYWYRSISAYIVAAPIFIDSIAALPFPPLLCCMMVHDLILYWQNVQQTLRRLTKSIPDLSLEREMFPQADGKPELVRTPRQIHFELEKVFIQSTINDFFRQLGFVNGYVSILSSFILLAWLISNSVLTLIGLQLNVTNGTLVIRFIQLLAIFIVGGASFIILKVKSSTEPAYKVLCSLAAVDSSLDKRRWISLMEVYTAERRYGFTLFNSKLFTILILLKVISYTFTVILIIMNIGSY